MFEDLEREILSQSPDAKRVEYSNGDVQLIVPGVHPQWGRVTEYSDGSAETVVNLY